MIQQPQIIQCKGYCFRQSEPLDHGALALVFKGWKKSNPDEIVAVKVLREPISNMTKDFQKIIDQISTQRKLDPQYVVQILQHGSFESKDPYGQIVEKYCFIMEFMNKGSLQRIVPDKKQLPQKKALQYIRKIVQCYKQLYANKIVHRDLKPLNILIKAQNGQQILKLADFGASKFSQNISLHSITGTEQYNSPQQVLGKQQKNGKCDIYSIGVIFFKLLYGTTTMKAGCTDKQTLITDPIQIKNKLSVLKISPQIVQFIIMCLQYEQKDRYSWENIFDHPLFNDIVQISLNPSFSIKLIGNCLFKKDEKNLKKCIKSQEYPFCKITSKQTLPNFGNYTFSIKIHKNSDKKKIMFGVITQQGDRFDFSLAQPQWRSYSKSNWIVQAKKITDCDQCINNLPSIMSINFNWPEKKLQSKIGIPQFLVTKIFYAHVWQQQNEDSFQFI